MNESSGYDPPRLGRKGCVVVGLVGFIGSLCLLLSTCVSNVEVMRAVLPDGALTARLFEERLFVVPPQISGECLVGRARTLLSNSARAICVRSDCHRTYISDLEPSSRNPLITLVVRLAGALGVTASYLLAD